MASGPAEIIAFVGDLATGLLSNQGKELSGKYQESLTKLKNQSGLTAQQYAERLAVIEAERDQLTAESKDAARDDYLKFGIIGGVFILIMATLFFTVGRQKGGS